MSDKNVKIVQGKKFTESVSDKDFIEISKDVSARSLFLRVKTLVTFLRDTFVERSTHIFLTVSDSPYTASVYDWIHCDDSGGNIVINLPTAVGILGKKISISKDVESSNTITVNGDGSETINGDTSKIINYLNTSISMESDGINWRY